MMQNTGKRSIHSKSRRSAFLRREIQSSENPSPVEKDDHKISYSKKCIQRARSRFKAAGSSRGNHTAKKGRRRQDLQESLDFIYFKYQGSKRLAGGKSSRSSHGENRGASDNDVGVRKLKRRILRKKKRKIVEDEASQLKRRTRYLLIKIKREQNLIDAYSGEGWKGQSREKIRPEKELERARKQILKCKLGIRDAIHQLDLLSSEGRIADSVMNPDGSIFHEHIFCSICKSCETFKDNDIILCDGACNCAFHQKCLDPPLTKIPPGDQGWLCKFCECKLEILEAVNAHLGACFSVNSKWEDIFREADIGTGDKNNYLDPANEWPSDDSEDGDYDPETSYECRGRTSTEESMPDNSSSFSSSFHSSSQTGFQFQQGPNYDGNEDSFQFQSKKRGRIKFLKSKIVEDSDDIIMNCQRQRRDVDYKKLHDEMFGKELLENEQQSEDEDWGPYQRKRKITTLDAGTTLAACDDKNIDMRLVSDGGVEDKRHEILHYRKTLFRIPRNAVEKLRRVFSENELPSRSVKENLAVQLGITYEKVSKWFKNARYAALQVRKAEGTKLHSNKSNHRLLLSGRKNQNSSGVKTSRSALPTSSGIRVPKNTTLLKKRSSLANTLSRTKHKQTKRRFHVDPVENTNLRWKTGLGDNSVRSNEEIASLTGASMDSEQLYFIEMERLYYLEERLLKLKNALNACEGQGSNSTERSSNVKLVIYVPVVEVKFKE